MTNRNSAMRRGLCCTLVSVCVTAGASASKAGPVIDETAGPEAPAKTTGAVITTAASFLPPALGQPVVPPYGITTATIRTEHGPRQGTRGMVLPVAVAAAPATVPKKPVQNSDLNERRTEREPEQVRERSSASAEATPRHRETIEKLGGSAP